MSKVNLYDVGLEVVDGVTRVFVTAADDASLSKGVSTRTREMTLKQVVEMFGDHKTVKVTETQHDGLVDYAIELSILQSKPTPYPYKCTIMPAKDVPNAVSKLINMMKDKHND